MPRAALWIQIHWIWIYLCFVINFERQKKICWEKTILFKKRYLFFKLMSPEEILVGWFSELWIYVLNLVSFASILFYIWIHKAPEYGSKTDPDARHWLRAGGIPRARRSRPKTDWLRNTEKYPVAWILHNQSQTSPCISRSYLCTKLWVNSNEKIYLSRIR